MTSAVDEIFETTGDVHDVDVAFVTRYAIRRPRRKRSHGSSTTSPAHRRGDEELRAHSRPVLTAAPLI
jgi:hypothetical protein